MEKTETYDINQIFEDAIKDPNLFSTIDIDNLLNSIETDKNDYLDTKTIQSVTDEIFEKVSEQISDTDNTEDICKKLMGYRVVDEVHELHKGKHVRWLRSGNNKLTTGGIVVDIKFMDNGIQVLCKNSMNRFVQYKFDDCITFQKLSLDEQVIMMAYKYTLDA